MRLGLENSAFVTKHVLRCQTLWIAPRRLIALISDPPVVRKILRHLGLPAEPPALAPPRSPPQMVFGF